MRPALIAAKVDKNPRWHGLRNTADYQMGRSDSFDRRDRLAFEKKSRHRRELQFGMDLRGVTRPWRACTRPAPPSAASNRTVVDGAADGIYRDRDRAAPTLSRVELDRDEALELFRTLMRNMALRLRCDLMHRDLSPLNILFWQGHLTVIDFLQAVDPRSNRNAKEMLDRDVAKVCRYFARYNIQPRSRPAD